MMLDFEGMPTTALSAVFLLSLAVLYTGIAAEMTGRRVRGMPARLVASLPHQLPRRRRLRLGALLAMVGLVPQVWVASRMLNSTDTMPFASRLVLVVEATAVVVWVAHLVRLPVARRGDARVQLAPDDVLPARTNDTGGTRGPGGGIVWVVIGVTLVIIALYAALQLSGLDPPIGQVAIPSMIIGLLLIVQGVERGLAVPAAWRPRAARVWARLFPPAAALVAIGGAYAFIGADWALLLALLAIVLVPLGWRAMSGS